MAVDPCLANAHSVLGLSQLKMAEKLGVNSPRRWTGYPGSMNLPGSVEHDRRRSSGSVTVVIGRAPPFPSEQPN